MQLGCDNFSTSATCSMYSSLYTMYGTVFLQCILNDANYGPLGENIKR